MSSTKLPDYVRINRESWNKINAEYTDQRAVEAWAQKDITWTVWMRPEKELKVLPPLKGKDVIELGCGTAYVAAWLKRDGARRVVAVDINPDQLETARRLDAQYGYGLELIEGNAESVALPDASFDLVVSEYGASHWCDPYKWIPEAARLLRRRGELMFVRNSTLSILCMPATGRIRKQLHRPQRGLHHVTWTDDEPAVEFNIGHSDMFRLLRDTGFELLDFQEIFAPEKAKDHPYYSFVTADWAKQWPSEEIWRARKRG